MSVIESAARLGSVEQLFLSVFRWYCKSVDLTFDEFIVCLSDRMTELERENLRLEIFVDDDAQRKGEDALVELANRLPNQGRHTRRWSDAPGRAVDWSETWLSREMGRCDRFCNLERILVPDKATRCALEGLADRWESVLHRVPKAADWSTRLEALRKARLALLTNRAPSLIGKVGSSRAAQSTDTDADSERGGIRTSSSTLPNSVMIKDAPQYLPSQGSGWSQNASRRLHHVDHEAATAIDAAVRLWEGNERRGEALAKFVERWLHKDQQSHLRAKNSNTLFEWTAALWVARAAWSLGWEVDTPLKSGPGKYSDLNMNKGEWRFRISKGEPKSPAPKPVHISGRTNGKDRLTEARRLAGLEARGQQPDIVMTFWVSGDPDNYVTYLGDAKRNETSDGLGYLSSSVMRAGAYLYAFGEWLHCRPRFTLFMLQGADKGREKRAEAIDQTEMDRLLQKPCEESDYPDILCIHPKMIGASGEDLAPWFVHLFKQARERLESFRMGRAGTVSSETIG